MPEISVSPKWDPRPKEYKLNPEQMKRYLAGEKMEDILSEGNAQAEAPQQEETREKEGEKDMGKAKVIGIKAYKELEERYENLKFELEKQQFSAKQTKELETLVKQKDAAIAELKKELDEVKSQPNQPARPLKELAEIENLKAEMQQSQDLFHEAMADKENSEKQIVALKNQVRRLEDALEEKTTLFEDLKERNRDLLQEVYPLKMLTFLKLKREVE